MTRSLLVIERGRIEKQYWNDLWTYRELFLMLAWRDITVRYKQTVIGFAWAIIRPLVTTLAFTVIFGKIAMLPTQGNIPYPLVVFVALLPWQLFSASLSSISESLVTNANLLSKVYFPRLLIPSATIAVSLVDFAVNLPILLLMMAWYREMPTAKILMVLPLTILTCIVALGPGLILCSATARFRDFKHALPFLVQFGLYISPVGFSSSSIPEKWRLLFELNPMVGVIDGFRWSILGSVAFPFRALVISSTFCLGFLYLGTRTFRRVEKTIVDVI